MVTLKARQVSEWKGRIVDVRNPDEFANERLPQAECVPLPKLIATAVSWDRTEPLLLMCKSGMRSKQAVEQLESAGFTSINMLEGGIDACKRDGVNVIVNRTAIPLYRQVMISAGLLALVGLLLTQVHSWFILVDWFVACGLIMGGATGTCPMARLLEKMPWNRGACCQGQNCA